MCVWAHAHTQNTLKKKFGNFICNHEINFFYQNNNVINK